MELSKELFEKTFSHLKASPATGKELLTMMEKQRKPKKFVLRRMAVAGAVLALAAALAMGANAATGGELFGTVVEYVQSWTSPDGSQVVWTFRGELGGEPVYYSVEQQGGTDGSVTVEEDENGAPFITYEDSEGNTVTGQIPQGEDAPEEFAKKYAKEYVSNDGETAFSAPESIAEE